MMAIQSFNQQKMALQEEVISRTQDLAIKTLEEEFERAKMDIQSLRDLRKLNAIIKRIGLVTNPRPRYIPKGDK